MLAHCASLTVNAVRTPRQCTHESEANYLGRVSKERIVLAVREAVSVQAAENIASMKKQAMAEAAEAAVAGKGCGARRMRAVRAPRYREGARERPSLRLRASREDSYLMQGSFRLATTRADGVHEACMPGQNREPLPSKAKPFGFWRGPLTPWLSGLMAQRRKLCAGSRHLAQSQSGRRRIAARDRHHSQAM